MHGTGQRAAGDTEGPEAPGRESRNPTVSPRPPRGTGLYRGALHGLRPEQPVSSGRDLHLRPVLQDGHRELEIQQRASPREKLVSAGALPSPPCSV